MAFGRPMDREAVAMLCHEMNRLLCSLQGDFSALPWLATDEHTRQSARQGVDWARSNPGATAEDMHENGPTKDSSLKQHPCMVPYSDLPEGQKLKDVLFLAIVRAMT
jgi:hypothetical protein